MADMTSVDAVRAIRGVLSLDIKTWVCPCRRGGIYKHSKLIAILFIGKAHQRPLDKPGRLSLGRCRSFGDEGGRQRYRWITSAAGKPTWLMVPGVCIPEVITQGPINPFKNSAIWSYTRSGCNQRVDLYSWWISPWFTRLVYQSQRFLWTNHWSAGVASGATWTAGGWIWTAETDTQRSIGSNQQFE